MENFLLLMDSVINFWKIPSSMSTVVDMIFAIMCGVILFYLLIPFLEEYPGSPPPGNKKNIPKVLKRSKARKKTITVEGFRNSQKNAHDTHNASRPMERPIHHFLLDYILRPFWYSKEKMNHLSLPQLLSYLKVLEVLIQQKFGQLLWGISSVFSEAVVATAWVSRESSSGGHKSVRFNDASDPIQALSLAKEPPQLFQDQHLPHQLVTPSLVGMIGVQEQENLPSSISNQRRSSFQRRAHRRACPTTEIEIQTSLPNVNEPGQHELNWKDIAGCDVQKCQAAISQPTDNLSRDTLPTKAIIFPEHYQMIHHHKEPQHEEKAINVEEQKGTHVKFCPSGELIQFQEDFQPNSDGYYKDQPELNQPAQPSILNSKCYKYSKMVGSVPTGVPLKKVRANSGIFKRFKKSIRVGAKDLPCTSSSTPGKCLEPRNPALRTDKLLSINTSKNLSFIDPNTKLKLESKIMQFPVKHRRRFPCVSDAEYCSKTAMILEKLHHQDPGGTRVETISSAWLETPLFEHSPPDVWETQRTPPPAAGYRPSSFHPYQRLRNNNVQPHTSCLQTKCQQRRTIQRTVSGTQQSNTSPGMVKHAPWKQFQDAASGHPCLSATTVIPEDRAPSSVAKQTSTLKINEELPHEWGMSLGSSEIPNGQAINVTLKGFESVDYLQTPIAQNSGELAPKIKVNYINIKSSEQPQSWPVCHHPDAPNTVHPAMVRLPSQHSLPNFQNGWQNLKTSEGLGYLPMSTDQSVETGKFKVHKDKIEAKNYNVFHPSEERSSILKSGGISQGESFERVRFSIPSSTQLKDTSKMEIQSSINIAGNREAHFKSSLKDITRDAAQYENVSTKYKGQDDSLRNESPLPVTNLQEVVDKKNLIYSIAVELQSLINVLLQSLVNNVDDPSKLTIDPVTQVPEYKVESLKLQLGESTYSSEGIYDPDHCRQARRMSSGHDSPEEHNHPFTFSGTGDKAESGIDDQRFFEQHLNKTKRRIEVEQHPTPMGYDHPSCYWRFGDMLESCLPDQKAGDLGQSGIKIGMGGSPHGSPKGHNSFRYTEIRGKQEPGVDYKAIDPHQNKKKGMGYDQLMSPKENDLVKDKGTGGQELSAIAAQEASDPDEIKTESGREYSPHRSPEMHNHLLRYREIGEKSQPSVNGQRVCDHHLNILKRIICDKLLNLKGKNYPCRHRVTGDKQQSGLADQKPCDSDQHTRNEMGSCPHTNPKWHNLPFRYREIGKKSLSCVNAQRTHNQHPKSMKRRGFELLPIHEGNHHSCNSKVVGDKQQSGLAHQRACDAGQIKKKSGMASCPHRCPDGYNFLFRYGITENIQQPGIVLKACEPHQITKGMGQPMSPKMNHSVKYRRTGGQGQSGLAA